MIRPLHAIHTLLVLLAGRLHDDEPERGDVPGWVMIAVMTAALVIALLAAVSQPLRDAVTNAITSVTGAKG